MNDDSISRDAVLDACSQSINILDAMSRIEDLPSVNPKPCEDAINRQEAIDCLNGKIKMSPDMVETFREYLQCVIDAIEGLASVMPKQRTGHWIEGKYKDTCSECRYTTKADRVMGKIVYDFCPFCGAKMESEEQA